MGCSNTSCQLAHVLHYAELSMRIFVRSLQLCLLACSPGLTVCAKYFLLAKRLFYLDHPWQLHLARVHRDSNSMALLQCLQHPNQVCTLPPTNTTCKCG